MPRANAARSSNAADLTVSLLGSRRAYYTMSVTPMLTMNHL